MTDSSEFEEVLEGFVSGEPVATAAVLDRFRDRLVALARQKILDPRLRAKFDPEDIVQSAFLTFWRRARDGEFELDDWESLWNLLAKITERRCHKYWKLYQKTNKRNLNRESSEIADVSSPTSDPLRSAIVTDLLDRLMHQLDESSQLTLVLKLQGFTETEICEAIQCSIRSVRRRVARIRDVLESVDSETPL